MRSKKLILIPVLSMVLAGCAIDTFDYSSSGYANLSTSQSSADDSLSSEGASSLDSEDVSSFDSVETSSSSAPTYVNGVAELRNPSGLNHNHNYAAYSSESYTKFKYKMKVFSNRLSDIFVKRYCHGNNNFSVSPLSIEMCLGLAMRCADGETREEILNAFDMTYDMFNTNFKLFYDNLVHTRKNDSDQILSQLLLANSIWIDDGANLKDSGLDALRDDYYCYSYGVDFDGDNGNANRAMSDFISQNTKGLLNPNLNISPETLFVLMNVLYSKGIWNNRGSDLPYASTEYQFTNSNGSKSNKRLLDGYYESGKPIINGDYSCFYTSLYGYNLYFVKPNAGKNLKDIFDEGTMDNILDPDSIITRDDEKMEKYSTKCIFPEFSASGDFDIKSILINDLGIQSLFSPANCDMSNLTDDMVYCDEIRHLTKLDVNKKGMEGAAVTYSSMAGAGAPQPDPYTYIKYTFVVDKEFGFILTHGNSVVFSGVVNNID